MNQAGLTPNEDRAGARATPRIRQESLSDVPEVPVRPALAPNVELLGEMQENGFEERQWLVRRGDRFIQLTELLYRVAEQADGKNAHDEMAEGVTRSTDWLVSAENVRQLLQSKLIPLGIVASAEGVDPQEVSTGRRTLSPLRVNGRAKLLGPRTIDGVANMLQILFAPFVLLPVLVAIAFAHGWLYLVHGLGGAVREVLYVPGLAIAVLGVVFISGVLHEFGHASALRYGGGRARAMGFGFYIVYPALYTDTSDSYRLGRWARVRTDLGGFYFHLIFALGLMIFSLLTGWEFLLVAVLLINLDIVYQCMPFVRFDGYWTLADLTGIPDFFSQMGAFLRSTLPIPGWKGDKLPDLKPWARGVFVAYVMVTIPVLAMLLFLLITRLPGIATTAWYSLLNQATGFSQALFSGNFLGMVTSVTQMLLLGLQVLGITYLLYSLGRMLTMAAWKRICAARRPEGEAP